MIEREDHDLAVLDLYIRSRLGIAAAAYAAAADLDERLAAVLRAGERHILDDPASAES